MSRNEDRYTIFQVDDMRLKFIAPYSLERYEKVIEWDKGYLVVLAKYSHNEELEEEYIDLVPILRALYMDDKEFLSSVEKVEVKYDEY